MKRSNTKQIGGTMTGLKAQLKVGDIAIIAEVTDYSEVYVRMCIEEKRSNKLVVTIANALIADRESFMQNMKNLCVLAREGKVTVSK